MGSIVPPMIDGFATLGGVESPPRTAPLSEGDVAPAFCLADADMDSFDLAEHIGRKIVVLHFYARDAMPSSTRLAIAFSEMDQAFERNDAIVVAVSLDDCAVHADFRDEHGVAMRLLSDVDGDACSLYGVLRRRDNGQAAVQRMTYVIGRDGMIHGAMGEMDAADLAAEVLRQVKELSGSRNGDRQEHRRHA